MDSTMSREEGLSPINILLVEDCESNVLLIELYLKDFPCVLDVADNGLVGLEKFMETRYDVVLMDIQMPVMDGYESTRRMREVERGDGRGRTPVIAITAHAFTENREKVLAAGCDRFMTKPVSKADLLGVIRGIMS